MPKTLTGEVDREKHLSSLTKPKRCREVERASHRSFWGTHPRYQAGLVGERAKLENDRVSLRDDDLAVDRATSFLRTRPPVGEEGE